MVLQEMRNIWNRLYGRNVVEKRISKMCGI